MKNKYYLIIITGGHTGKYPEVIEADNYNLVDGAYRFYNNTKDRGAFGEEICRYPISRTIIEKTERIE